MDLGSRVAVVGLGTMGAGIAEVFARSGWDVVGVERTPADLQRGLARVARSTQRAVDRGKLTAQERAEVLGRVRGTTDLADLGDRDLAVEAISEDLAAKRVVMAALDAVLAPHAVIATNTSSLSVTEISVATHRPDRVVGMHFFNPAPLMPLVEVVQGDRTAEAVVQATVALAEQWGKRPVVAQDNPGFIVNRIARPFYLEALRLLGDGVADVPTIDRLVRSAGFRLGPFELLDLIGLDVNLAVTQSVYDATFGEPRFRPHPIQARLVAAGRLGRKTGGGFY